MSIEKELAKGKWFVLEVDEGFKSSDKMLQSLVDAYNINDERRSEISGDNTLVYIIHLGFDSFGIIS